jgi:hypothetical protein
VCEKNGWDNYLILFCLVNIPTFGTGSSQTGGDSVVKKWENWMFGIEIGGVFLGVRFTGAGFSKTGLGVKSNDENRHGGLSTFQGTTVTATSISFLFI